jgi:hypothetical protein
VAHLGRLAQIWWTDSEDEVFQCISQISGTKMNGKFGASETGLGDPFAHRTVLSARF